VPGSLVALAERLQGVCLGRGLSVSLAESCTGGLVAATITAVAGSSGYFLGGVVTYANTAKAALLDVPDATLAAHGAVSAQTAKQMAHGARERFGSSLAASVTGIAGPDGGTAEKPVGLCYVGLASASGVEVRRFQLEGDRPAIGAAAAGAGLVGRVDAAARAAASAAGRAAGSTAGSAAEGTAGPGQP
jgi:nicotinamide-nucleotide amidase